MEDETESDGEGGTFLTSVPAGREEPKNRSISYSQRTFRLLYSLLNNISIFTATIEQTRKVALFLLAGITIRHYQCAQEAAHSSSGLLNGKNTRIAQQQKDLTDSYAHTTFSAQGIRINLQDTLVFLLDDKSSKKEPETAGEVDLAFENNRAEAQVKIFRVYTDPKTGLCASQQARRTQSTMFHGHYPSHRICNFMSSRRGW